MQVKNNLPYYIAAAVIFVLLKLWFTIASNHQLLFLLYPTNKIVGILTGSSSVYIPEKGFFFENLKIVIDKSCSGFNFWVLSFMLISYRSEMFFNKVRDKILAIPASLILAYLLTIFVNTSRIFTSIILQDSASIFLTDRPHLILHQVVGVIINLSFLILAYLILDKLFTKKTCK